MTADETTRIEFAERQGWKKTAWAKWHNGDRFIEYCELPNPTDRNHVHTALMGMSPLERQEFCIILSKTYDSQDRIVERVLFETLLSTLVSCYLEATKGRVK
jgi:hypothetical protein